VPEAKLAGDAALDRRVAKLNIAHYMRLLDSETDETRRQTLMRLLAEEEEAKLADSRPPQLKQRPE
jgi:hypothetical protein